MPDVFDSARTAAVVVGLDSITGLQTARILSGHDIPVIGVTNDAGHPCARTRAVRRIITCDSTGDELLDALVDLGPRLSQPAVLYPCRDASVLVLARNRHRLQSWYRLALPKAETVERLMDKVRFHDLAQQLGLRTPPTKVLSTRADAENAAEQLRFPCLIKPSLRTPLWQRHVDGKVHWADSPADLLRLYDRFASYAPQLVAQQWIEGPDAELYTCNCYFDRAARPLATFVTRKLRQWPPRAGTGCLGEECRNDTVRDMTVALFRATGFHGLCYLEVKREAKTGEHYVIEANVGRPTGRSATAEAGGVELLYAMYCDVTGQPLPAKLTQSYGMTKWIYWRRDVRSALYYWRRGELSLRQWRESWRGKKTDAVFCWRDPLPFVADCVSAAARARAKRDKPVLVRAG